MGERLGDGVVEVAGQVEAQVVQAAVSGLALELDEFDRAPPQDARADAEDDQHGDQHDDADLVLQAFVLRGVEHQDADLCAAEDEYQERDDP